MTKFILIVLVGVMLSAAHAAQLSDSVRFFGRVGKILRWASKTGIGRPYVDWVLDKVDSVQLYVEAGSSVAGQLDPGLLDALAGLSSGQGRSVGDYDSSWRYYVPSYVRKSKTKLRDEEKDDDDLVGSYGHSHGSYGGGGYGGGGHGGGGYGGGGYGGGGHGGGYGGGYGGGGHGGGYGGGDYGGGGYGGGGYGGGYGGGHGGGGYGGGGHGGGYGGGHGGGYGGGGYGDSDKAFSILGGLSFLTFLGVLLYQLATTSAAGRAFHISDMDVPLHLSDVHGMMATSPADGMNRLDMLITSAHQIGEEESLMEEESPLDRMVGVFNTLWKAHQTGSFRCVQRRLCETLTDVRNRRVVRDPLIQMTMITMVDWLGDYDAAEMADRTFVMMSSASTNSSSPFDCSALVPKCRAGGIPSSPAFRASSMSSSSL